MQPACYFFSWILHYEASVLPILQNTIEGQIQFFLPTVTTEAK